MSLVSKVSTGSSSGTSISGEKSSPSVAAGAESVCSVVFSSVSGFSKFGTEGSSLKSGKESELSGGISKSGKSISEKSSALDSTFSVVGSEIFS